MPGHQNINPETVFKDLLTGLTDAELAAMARYQLDTRNIVFQILTLEEVARRGRNFSLQRDHLKLLNKSSWALRRWRRTRI